MERAGRTGPLCRTEPPRAVQTAAVDTHSQRDARGALEEELVARLARGECEEPLSALYDRYATKVYGLGIHLLRDAGQAEDLVQETFVRLWRSAHRYDPARSSVKTFVFTLARRAAVDLWRRRGAPVPHVLSEPSSDDSSGTDEFEQLLLRLELGEALAELTPAHREELELQYREDLTQAQVADRLGIPLGTVKTRTMHALRALARHVDDRSLRG